MGKSRTFNIKNQYGLTLDGVNEYIDYGNILAYERTQALSFSCWVTPISLASPIFLLVKRTTAAGQRGWQFVISSLGNGCSFFNTVTTNGLNVRGVTALTTGTLYHLCITYDGSSTPAGIKVFINNVEDVGYTTVQNNLSATIITSVNLKSGNWSTVYGNAMIDEMVLYESVLSTAERTELYNLCYPINLKAHPLQGGKVPVFYHRFGDAPDYHDGTNWQLTDRSGNGYSGVSVNMEAADRTKGAGIV